MTPSANIWLSVGAGTRRTAADAVAGQSRSGKSPAGCPLGDPSPGAIPDRSIEMIPALQPRGSGRRPRASGDRSAIETSNRRHWWANGGARSVLATLLHSARVPSRLAARSRYSAGYERAQAALAGFAPSARCLARMPVIRRPSPSRRAHL